jgi:diguanylate cyclase (GGDEF)-like protein
MLNPQLIEQLTRLAAADGAAAAEPLLEQVLTLLGDQAEEIGGLLCAMVARVREVEALRSLAGTDELTRLANRRSFQSALHRELARAVRAHTPVAILLLDLDGLKPINDAFGHEAGDAAICAVAEVCRDTLRRSDLAARCGGDEFAVLLPDTSAEQAMIVAGRLRAAVQERSIGGRQLGISIGVASSSEHGGVATADVLLAEADAALYHDKRDRKAVAAVVEPATSAPAAA